MRRGHRGAAALLPLVVSLAGCTHETGGEPLGDGAFQRSSLEREVSPVVDATVLADTVSGEHALAFALYRELSDAPGNLVISPYSIRTAFAQVWAGANGETANQIADVMHFDSDATSVHTALNAIDQRLVHEGSGLTLKTANALWAAPTLVLHPSYLDTLARHYGAGVGIVDFADSARAADTINSWVSMHTAGLIAALVSEAQVQNTRVVLTNALYLQAEWEEPFVVESSGERPFTAFDGTQRNVPMMYAYRTLSYAQTETYQAAVLPFARVDGRRCELLVVLPQDFARLERSDWSAAGLQAILSALTPTLTVLRIPRVDLSGKLELNDALNALGMPKVFEGADFSGISTPSPGNIKHVLHDVVLSWDEAGATGAAATAVVFADGSISTEQPVSLVLDRPFLFALREASTGTLLFVGRVVDP